MSVYYNENDPFAAAWLRELIMQEQVAEGWVDERSIKDVQPSDLAGFTQHHFFAGIGGWSLALRLAGWEDRRGVFTGSCPCQPFSAAGKRLGTADERHLWPEFQRLIAQCKPPVVFGEQVASKDGREWLAGVRADLEALGYAVGAADLCAAGVGAPHIRQRLWWVADTHGGFSGDGHLQPSGQYGQQPEDGSVGSRLAHTNLQRERSANNSARVRNPSWDGEANGLSHADSTRQFPEGQGPEAQTRDETRLRRLERGRGSDGVEHSESVGRQQWGAKASWWGASTRRCTDGRDRRVEPSIQPLAHGVPNRVGMLRGAGNAIVPEVAAQWIEAYLGVE